MPDATLPHDSTGTIEVVRADHPRGPFRAAIFDFDGTLSLLRRNWQNVMIPMMVDVLAATGTNETREQLGELVEDFVMRLNGRQTIYQMIQLTEEIQRRGGQAEEPLVYKHRYHDLLWEQVRGRVEAVREGRVAADEMTVPGSRDLLDELRARSVTLYLASGTDLPFVRSELEVLGLSEYFGQHVYGALDDYRKFSKAMIIARMIEDTGVQGHELIGFGDGFVEIEEVRKVGGLAVGVASNEESRSGVNDWKRQRLIRAGADLIIGDYRQRETLFAQVGLV
jgi:phosphoglycolate phosphatase-like HAD superfamily hydrolase